MNKLLDDSPLNWKNFLILSLLFILFISWLMNDALFDSSKLISASDQLNAIGGRWFRDSFWLSQWDPTRLGGYPTLDATYAQPYHPITLLHFLMDPAKALAWMFAATVMSGFVSAVILGNYLTKNWKLAGLIGLLFSINPQFFTHIYPGHDGKMMVIAIAPLGVYAVLRLCREGWLWGAPLFVVSTVWAITGHIQLAYFYLWGIAFISLFENFIGLHKPKLKIAFLRQALVGVGLIAALGISSIQILPPYVYTTKHSVRADAQQKSFGHSASWSNHYEETASILLPEFAGYTVPNKKSQQFDNPYWGHNAFKLNHDSAGTVLIILGLLGIFISNDRRLSLFILSSLSLLVIYSVGGDTPLFQIFYEVVPGAKSFRAPSMVLFWIPILLIMSSAPVLKDLSSSVRTLRHSEATLNKIFFFLSFSFIGLALLRLNWPSAKGSLTIIYSFALIAGTIQLLRVRFNSIAEIPKGYWVGLALPFTVALTLGLSHGPGTEVAHYFSAIEGQKLQLAEKSASLIWSSLLWALFTLGIIFYVIKTKLKLSQTLVILAALTLVGNLSILSPFNTTVDRETKLPDPEKYQAFFRMKMPDSLNDYRVFALNKALNPNFGKYYGIRFLQGDHDNKISTFRSFKGGRSSENFIHTLKQGLSPKNIQSNPFLNLMGVKYILVPSQSGIQMKMNSQAFPRTKFYAYSQVERHDNIPSLLKNQEIDYHHSIVFDSDSDIKTNPLPKPEKLVHIDSLTGDTTLTQIPTKSPIGQTKIIESKSMSEYTIEIDVPQEGFVLFNENYHPDWRISIQGQEFKPLRAFHTLLAFEVPQGKHIVQVRFSSRSVETSKVFIFIGLGLLILLIMMAWKQRRES